MLFLITSHRRRASSEETPSIRAQLAGRSSRTVAKTRASVTQMEADICRHTQKIQTQSRCCKSLTHTLECSVSGDFYESHCWCLTTERQLSSLICFLLNLVAFSGCFPTFFPPLSLLTPSALDHPAAAVSGSFLVNVYPSFNLNPSRPPARSGTRGESWPIDNRSTHSRFIATQMFMDVCRLQKGGSCLRELL